MSGLLGDRLVAVWDMLEFYAQKFFALSSLLARLDALAMAKGDYEIIPADVRARWREQVERQRLLLEGGGFTFSLLTLDRLIAEFQNSSLIYARLRELTTDLHDRITDELNETAFWQISTQDKPLFVANVFGERASAAFPSMNFDMEESAKCLGLDRPTASVFHLMRLMEASLRIIVREMNMPGVVVTNPSWDTILKKIDDELHKTYQHKLPAWRSREQFFAEVAAHLRTIKTAWRNPTMHVEKKYTPEEARGIFNAVRAFILHLATEVNSDQP